MIVQRLRQLRRIDCPNLHGSAGRNGCQLWIAWYVEARGRLCICCIDQRSLRQRQLSQRFPLWIPFQMGSWLFVAEWIECDFIAACVQLKQMRIKKTFERKLIDELNRQKKKWVILPAVMRKSSFLETCSAVTGPGFGGNDRINRLECMSNISARVSSHPIIARWLSIAIVMARTYARAHKSVNYFLWNVNTFSFHFHVAPIAHTTLSANISQHGKCP